MIVLECGAQHAVCVCLYRRCRMLSVLAELLSPRGMSSKMKSSQLTPKRKPSQNYI